MNRNNLIIWGVVVIAVISGFIIFKKEPNDLATKPIVIGGISALSGVGTAIGEEERNGALLAVEEINKAGGVLGRPLKLVSEDVSLDKLKNAATVAHKLIDVDKVVAIVGAQWDEPAAAILPIIEASKVPMIGPDITDTIEINGLGKYLFSTWYDNRIGVTALLTFAKKQDYKNIAIIRPLSAGFWKFTADEFTKQAPAFGVKVVADIDIGNPLTTDYRTFIAKAKQSKPDAIFFVTSDPGECVFLKQMQELGLTVPLLSTEAAGNYASLEACAKEMENLYFSTPKHFSGYERFASAYKDKYGHAPQFPSAVTAYDAVKVLAAALEKTNGEGGEKLQQVLAQTKDFPGASLPSITFNQKGFSITPDDTFEVQTVRNSKFVKAQ